MNAERRPLHVAADPSGCSVHRSGCAAGGAGVLGGWLPSQPPPKGKIDDLVSEIEDDLRANIQR
jgi:hypothetical protein